MTHFITENQLAQLEVSEKEATPSFAILARIQEVTAQNIPSGRYSSNCTSAIVFSHPVTECLVISALISSIVIVIGGSPIP